MGLDAEIAKRAGVKTLEKGSLTLVDSTDALTIIEICISEQITIVGIDGFTFRDSVVVPDMNSMADFSGASWRESIDSAKQFIKATMRPGLWYEFVVEPADGRGTVLN